MRTIGKFSKLAVSIAAIGAVGLTATACSSDPSPVAEIKSIPGGTTSVALNADFGKALAGLKVAAAPTGKATFDKATSTFGFPITGGHVKVYKKGDVTPYVQGELDHNGSGFSLTAGKTTVTLSNFTVDPGNNSNLKGDVSAGSTSVAKQTKLFDLNGNTLQTPTVANNVATLTGTQVLLGKDAAALLNKTFGITALKGGMLIGIATIKADAK